MIIITNWSFKHVQCLTQTVTHTHTQTHTHKHVHTHTHTHTHKHTNTHVYSNNWCISTDEYLRRKMSHSESCNLYCFQPHIYVRVHDVGKVQWLSYQMNSLFVNRQTSMVVKLNEGIPSSVKTGASVNWWIRESKSPKSMSLVKHVLWKYNELTQNLLLFWNRNFWHPDDTAKFLQIFPTR